MKLVMERPANESKALDWNYERADYPVHIGPGESRTDDTGPNAVWIWSSDHTPSRAQATDVLVDLVSRDASGTTLLCGAAEGVGKYWWNIGREASQFGSEGPWAEGKANELTAKLKDRLSQFAKGSLETGPPSQSILSTVTEMVGWLAGLSDTVSATVAGDGMLSIATVFPNEVRLYIEVEIDGSSEAAVTRARRYARDISISRLEDLTPEAILEAIGSI